MILLLLFLVLWLLLLFRIHRALPHIPDFSLHNLCNRLPLRPVVGELLRSRKPVADSRYGSALDKDLCVSDTSMMLNLILPRYAAKMLELSSSLKTR